jgi:hypothetical protein
LSKIWTPPDPDDWGVVQDVEPSARSQRLPDGRVMQESRLTLSPAAIERMWQGYICAKCLQELDEAYPEFCPNDWCRFPIREDQRRQLERDFVGEHPGLVSGFPMDRELEHLERVAHEKRPM